MNEDRGRGYFQESDLDRGRRLSGSLTGVFGLMFAGLLVSAFAAFFVISSPAMMDLVFGTRYGFFGFLIAEIVLVMFAVPRIWGMSPAGGILLFFAYAALNGITLSVILLAYDIGTITTAFVAAAGMFGVMAVYGALTKADLSRAGNLLFMALIGLILATVLNLFFASSMFDTIICYVGIAIFVGLTAYDVQRIRTQMELHGETMAAGLMVMGALNLYLDFINIFLFLIRLMGRRR